MVHRQITTRILSPKASIGPDVHQCELSATFAYSITASLTWSKNLSPKYGHHSSVSTSVLFPSRRFCHLRNTFRITNNWTIFGRFERLLVSEQIQSFHTNLLSKLFSAMSKSMFMLHRQGAEHVN